MCVGFGTFFMRQPSSGISESATPKIMKIPKTTLLVSLLLFWLVPHSIWAEWVTLRDCRLVPSEGNDGDSFRFVSGGQEYIARLYFVDSAEKDDQVPDRIVQQMEAFGVSEDKVYQYGHEAKMFTERVLAGPFTVVTRFQDARGRSKLPRHYSFVFPNGSRQDLGSLLTEAGLARSFGQTAKNDLRLDRTHYDRLEAKARREGMGIFGGRKLPVIQEEPAKNEPTTSTASSENSTETPLPFASDLMIPLIDLLHANLLASNEALLAAVRGDAPSTQSAAPAKININTASLGDLEFLRGVSAAIARRIVQNRPYSCIEDLRRVPRLGEATIKGLLPLVEF
jgi:DNA uptake protein ComE-like DNA-binding protein